MTTNKSLLQIFCLFFALAMVSTSCEIEEFGNPNGPTAEDLLDGASLADLQLLVSGLESVMRNDMEFHYNSVNIVGREYYDLTSTDPRYTGELLGAQGAVLDNNGFLTTRAFAQVYRVARNANNLIGAVDASLAGLTDDQKGGIVAIANTLKAYSLLLELGRQYQNGIRIDVDDVDNLGGFLSYEGSLDAIESLLNDASDALAKAGDEFPIALSPGFAGLDTPEGFNQFNRAIAARVNLYQNDTDGLKAALNASFYDMDGAMETGAYHVFGTSGNDISNPLVVVPDQDLYVAQTAWVDEAEDGDLRVANKVGELAEPASLDGLTGSFQIRLYPDITTSVPMIRNEELILMMAEANVGTDNGAAVALINKVRTAAGLDDYAGGTSDDELIDAILNERRYSLFGEGHRWIDMRRFDKLDEITIDRAGDVIHTQFPRPVTEEE